MAELQQGEFSNNRQHWSNTHIQNQIVSSRLVGHIKSVLWDYIFFKFFLWLIGNQAQSSAVNNHWKLRGKWSGTVVSDICMNPRTHFILQEFFQLKRHSHEWLLYKLTHTCKAHFWAPLVTSVATLIWNNQPDSHLNLSIPSFRFCLIPFLPLNHPLRLFAFSICLPLALILSLSTFSARL